MAEFGESMTVKDVAWGVKWGLSLAAIALTFMLACEGDRITNVNNTVVEADTTSHCHGHHHHKGKCHK